MTIWLSLAILAYLLTAGAFVIDKYLLAAPIPKPFAYAFWVAILSTPIILLIPFFNIYLPGAFFFVVSFASGGAFFGGLIFLYKSIKKSDVSVAATQVGVTATIFTYIFSLLILKDVLPLHNLLALLLLLTGMVFLGKAGRDIVWYGVGAGALIAVSFVLLKWTFIQSDFVNGLFWTRIGFIGSALLALTSKRARAEIRSSAKNAPVSSKLVFAANKILAAVAFLLLYYSILLGNVTVINALLGFQFLFVFLIALALRNRLPSVKEDLKRGVLTNKLIGISLVLAGFLAILT